jgi:glucosamine--fructose-6-phosphate aminotransferase (isomerizing)
MSHTFQEIESQPAVWRSVIHDFKGGIKSLEGFIKGLEFKRIIAIGCGSTHYLAQTAAQLLTLKTGYPAQVYPSSEAWLMPDLFPVEDSLLLAISRSGTTTETIRAVERYRADGGKTVLVITCYPQSLLAELADFVLCALEAQEASVVQTRSFTSMVLLSAGFACVLGNQAKLLAEMDKLPDILESLVVKYGLWPKIWADRDKYKKIFFLGNGPNYGLACEAMLKVKEMSLSWTEAYHTLEFRHGPMSLVDDHTLVVGLVSDTTHQAELDVLRDLQKLGACIVLCDGGLGDGLAWSPEFHIITSNEVNEWFRGVLVMPLMHRLGYQRALGNGQNPDQPTNLRQVIEF